MRVFQEEIFGPVVSVTTFKDEAEALEIANDTMYGLGRRRLDARRRRARSAWAAAIKAGRVWTNCYHLYPAHAAFGGYKTSGVGRENHKMMLDHYTQTKNLLVSYDPKRARASSRPRDEHARPRHRHAAGRRDDPRAGGRRTGRSSSTSRGAAATAAPRCACWRPSSRPGPRTS